MFNRLTVKLFLYKSTCPTPPLPKSWVKNSVLNVSLFKLYSSPIISSLLSKSLAMDTLPLILNCNAKEIVKDSFDDARKLDISKVIYFKSFDEDTLLTPFISPK